MATVARQRSRRRIGGQAQIDAAVAGARDPAIYAERLKGKTERQIAREMGIAHATVHGAIERQIAEQRETVERQRDLMVGRLGRVQEAMIQAGAAGDTKAVTALVAVEKRLAELLGLDAPKRVDVQGSVTTKYVAEWGDGRDAD